MQRYWLLSDDTTITQEELRTVVRIALDMLARGIKVRGRPVSKTEDLGTSVYNGRVTLRSHRFRHTDANTGCIWEIAISLPLVRRVRRTPRRTLYRD